MKKLGIVLGIIMIPLAHADNPASKEYVDQTFSAIQQTTPVILAEFHGGI